MFFAPATRTFAMKLNDRVCAAHGIRIMDDVILLRELRRSGAR
jgi:hypothetical protein